MFSIFAPPTHTRNYSHRSYLFKLFALFALLTASLSATADTYVKVTSADDLVVGENYIIVESSSSTTYILAGAINNGKFTAITTGFTISDDKSTIITSTATPNEYKLGSSSKYYTLKNGNKFLGYNTGTDLRFSKTDSNKNNEKWTISSNSTYGYVIVNAATTDRGIGRSDMIIGAYQKTDYATYKPCVIYKKQLSITVTGVSISPTTATMTVGDKQTLTATVSPDNATNKTVTWSSNASGVATVDSNTGEVTAVAPGTATITATTEDGSYTASCTVTVNPASTKTPVNITAFSATNTTLIVGGTTTTTVANDQEDWTAAYTYSSSNSAVATVNESGVITAVSKGTATITATLNVSSEDENYRIGDTTSKSVEITVNNPSHTAHFSINGTIDSNNDCTTEEGESITFPANPADIYGKKFVGWYGAEYSHATEEPAYVTSAVMGKDDVTYYAVFATCTPGDISYTIDIITVSETGATSGESFYKDWSGKTVSSDAVYAGNSAGGSNIDPCIQMRSTSPSGIVSTTSGGKVTKIEIVWNNSTDRKLNIYGSNTAYTAASNLYADNTKGTLLGSLSSKSNETILEISGDYKYIGLRSNDEALYLYSISITWMNEVPDTYSGYCTTVTTGETSIGSGNEDPASGKYYATYSSTQKFVVPKDVTVAQVIEENSLIYLKRYAAGDVVEANTGVLLESTKTIDNIAFVLTAADATDLGVENVLKASGDGIKADKMRDDNPANSCFYRLTKGTLNGETVFGFYWKVDNGDAFDLGANKAYMVLPKNDNVQSAPRYVWLGGQTTAIDGLNADTEATVGSDERIYSLDGRRVEGQLKRGIYVKNGKKFIVR